MNEFHALALKSFGVFLTILIFSLPGPALSAEAEADGTPAISAGSTSEASQLRVDMVAGNAGRKPRYVPPYRGRPEGRIGGGGRGVKELLFLDEPGLGPDPLDFFGPPMLAAICPDHTGKTTVPSPRIFWYVTMPVDRECEFVLKDEKAIDSLVCRNLGKVGKAGFHCVDLREVGVSLEKGKSYQWFVSLIMDPKDRARDIVVSGRIELSTPVPASGLLPRGAAGSSSGGGGSTLTTAGSAPMTMEEAVCDLAEAGLWYDSVTAAMEVLALEPAPKGPGMTLLRDLLDQAGLLGPMRDAAGVSALPAIDR